MRLSELRTGESATVVKVLGHGGFCRRIIDLGFVRETKVKVLQNSPLQETIEYQINGRNIALRRTEAEMVVVVTEREAVGCDIRAEVGIISDDDSLDNIITKTTRHIDVAIIGNHNIGKTALFNYIAGANYSGATVDAKRGRCSYKGYELHITDLPGTYALSESIPTETYVRQYLIEQMPDVVLNIVAASNLERNLFLTTELVDMGQRMVVALNKYDELEATGSSLDYDLLGKMMGVPMIPIFSGTERGVEELLDTIIASYENRDERTRHIHIYQGIIEESLQRINKALKLHREQLPKCFPPRYFAMKMLEGDERICEMLRTTCRNYPEWERICREEREHLHSDLRDGETIVTAVANQKQGFVAGALRETLRTAEQEHHNTDAIDAIVTHRIWGYPIFACVMWLLFYCTFSLGSYPQQWLESLVATVGSLCREWLPDGTIKDMIIDGAIGGVGSVIVFLPNIMILYLFISFMEDSGYLARAAFIMDKVMHKVGLHGKSFIPLVMGFGCNVPAILAARTIESRSSRLITIFILPFMSCSARMPVYILLLGTFFSVHSGTIMFGLYLLGIIMAVVTSRLMRRFVLKHDETPFVMELPPYRMPTAKAIVSHMWERCRQYLRKMGGLILIASLVVWFLGYYPVAKDNENGYDHFEQSYIARISKACEPVFKPLGLDWKSGVAAVSGIVAKELMVSTLGVMYPVDDTATDNAETASMTLHERLAASGDFSPASILALLVVTLLYFPCIATLGAIASECGWKWAVGSAIYNTTLAWVMAWIVYNVANIFL